MLVNYSELPAFLPREELCTICHNIVDDSSYHGPIIFKHGLSELLKKVAACMYNRIQELLHELGIKFEAISVRKHAVVGHLWLLYIFNSCRREYRCKGTVPRL